MYIPGPGVGLQLAGVGTMEWQAPTINKYDSGRIRDIENKDTRILENWLGRGDGRLREEERHWERTEMGHSN